MFEFIRSLITWNYHEVKVYFHWSWLHRKSMCKPSIKVSFSIHSIDRVTWAWGSLFTWNEYNAKTRANEAVWHCSLYSTIMPCLSPCITKHSSTYIHLPCFRKVPIRRIKDLSCEIQVSPTVSELKWWSFRKKVSTMHIYTRQFVWLEQSNF